MKKATVSRPWIRLSSKRLGFYLGIAALVSLVIQLVFRAAPIIVLLAGLIVVFGLVAFISKGAYNAGSWFVIFYVSGNVLVAVYAKTLMGQPLDSFLFAPLDSFLVLLACVLELCFALIIASIVPLGRPLLRPTSNVSLLRRLSWGSFAFGLLSWFLNYYFQGSTGGGHAIFAILQDLLLMAVIARTAMLLEMSNDSKNIDSALALILAASVFLGLRSDSKTRAAYPIVSYFATILFYRRGLPLKQLLVLIIGGALFLFMLVPMIQAWRYLGLRQISLKQRVVMMLGDAQDVLLNGKYQEFVDLGQIQFHGGYYDYFGGDGNAQQVLGRYASVQQIDPVIAQVNWQHSLGGNVIWPAFTRLLPRAVYPNKSPYIEGYYILVDLGLISPDAGKYPTVPLSAQAYAAFGVPGVLFLPFFTFLGFLLALKKFGWNLYRNVYTIFLFCVFIVVYAAQGTLGQYAGAVLLNIPLYLAVFILLGVSKRSRW